MTLLHQAAQKAVDKLKQASGGLAYFLGVKQEPRFVVGSQNDIRAVIDSLESALQQQPEPVTPEGYELVMVPKLQPDDEPDWDECIRQAEVATGLKVERHTLSIVIREVRRWLAGRQSAPPALQEEPREPVARWHELKTDPDVFDAVADGRKTFEIRLNDRDFRVGDGLLLRRTLDTGWAMKNTGAPLEYTGEELRRVVSHVLHGPVYGLAAGWVILSLAASPSTTRQQEVGSEDELVELRATVCGLNYLVRTWRDRAVGAGWTRDAAAPSTPENADGGPHG